MQVQGYKERWVKAHEISKEWVARMTTLVECWNKLDGNVGELSSWVATKVIIGIREGCRKKNPYFFMVFCQTGGRGVSEGSEKTILLF